MPEEIEGQDQELEPEEEVNELEEQPTEPEGEEGKEEAPKEGETPEPEEKLTPGQIANLRKKADDYDALLPEFTKKSQRLAELEKGQPKTKTEPKEEPFYMKKGWVPQTYEELRKAIIDAGKRGETKALDVLKQVEVERATAKAQVDEFVRIVKEKDPEFDEDDFFEFADQHKFPIKSLDGLYSVYSAYLEVQEAGTTGARKARKSILGRRGEKISAPKSGKETPYSMPYSKIRGHASSFDAVKEVLDKRK